MTVNSYCNNHCPNDIRCMIILCSDFIVLSVGFLKGSPRHKVFTAPLKTFQLRILYVLVMRSTIVVTVQTVTSFATGCLTLKLSSSFDRWSWPISLVALKDVKVKVAAASSQAVKCCLCILC